MRSLRHYLTESARTYNYTIKILGDCDSKFLTLFKHNLSKFDPVKIEEPKTTPIQKNPFDFPESENESVTIIKAEFRYPATEPLIQQCAQASGCQINKVRMFTTEFVDGMEADADKVQNRIDSGKALLDTPELEDDGKEASKDYANQYLDKVVPKEPSFDIPYAAKTQAKDVNKTKEGINTQSPMSKMTRPEKPQTGGTGFSKNG